MPQIVDEKELSAIAQSVSLLPEGGSLEEIAARLETPLHLRTLQRRLALLVEQKRLVAEGPKKGRRYRVPAAINEDEPEKPTERQESSLPVSKEAQSVRRNVRFPIHQRKPVGYNRVFLENYRPNHTHYLSNQLRDRLAKAGDTPGDKLPAGTYVREIYNRLLIDLSWNSSRLEGNTYSLLETETLLELGASAEGKAAEETQMILNHKAAIDMLVEQAGEIGFNRYTILNLHGLLSDNLLKNPEAGGRLRARLVEIGGTVFHPLQTPQIIEECFNQILVTAEAIHDPFE